MHVCGDLCSFSERRRSPELVNSMRKQPAEAVHQLCSNLAFFTHVECCNYHFDAIPHQPNMHTHTHKWKQATRHTCACQLTYMPTTHTYVPPELHMFCVSCLSVSAYAQCHKPLIMGSRALHSEHTHTPHTPHTPHAHTCTTQTRTHIHTQTCARAHTHTSHTPHTSHTHHTLHTLTCTTQTCTHTYTHTFTHRHARTHTHSLHTPHITHTHAPHTHTHTHTHHTHTHTHTHTTCMCC